MRSSATERFAPKRVPEPGRRLRTSCRAARRRQGHRLDRHKTLQDQLYDRDLPAVRHALASGATIALLKGRANYVCLYRLRRAENEGRLASATEAAQLRSIARFAATSTTGDRADLASSRRMRPCGSTRPRHARTASVRNAPTTVVAS
jgi:hypothetical protein